MIIKRYSLQLIKESGTRYNGINNAFNNSEEIYRMMTEIFNADKLPEEHVWVILLNKKLKLIGVSEVSMGTVDMSIVQPRDVLTRVLMSGAIGFILVHNHPSGDPTPSQADFETSARLDAASNIIGINMLDSIIIGENSFMSANNR